MVNNSIKIPFLFKVQDQSSYILENFTFWYGERTNFRKLSKGDKYPVPTLGVVPEYPGTRPRTAGKI